MDKYLLAFSMTFFCSTSAIAAPDVSGNIISWPDDGYYQVQRATDYASLCEGTSRCLVDDGSYIVINHTTGERFENVVVPEPSETETGRDFQVVGNTIRFPENNWYQVQDSRTYASLCNGLMVCEVSAGTYIVINHTTGVRHESVVVGEPSQPVGESPPPSVDGNVISWADDGWYQVQASESYESICQGGLSCEVEPGNYRVINLTTGVRFEGIEIAGPVSPPTTPPGNPGERPVGIYPAQLSADDANAQVPDETGEDSPPAGTRYVGDVNGDGLEDVSVFLPGAEVYNNTVAIVFADADGSYPDLPLDTSPDAGVELTLTHGFVIEDVGYDVLGMGDVNGDGFDDLMVRGSGFFTLARSTLLAGAASFPERLNTDSLPDDQVLLKMPNLGLFSSAGDINGDGAPDILIVAPAEVSGGVVYGKPDLNVVFDTVEELRDIALLPGCGPVYSCSLRAIGDFDADGFDDLYISRLGAGICGFASFTAVIYGSRDGIEKRDDYTTYPAGDITRIVSENGGNCYPSAVARPYDVGDVDGDGAADIILGTDSSSGSKRYLIFGMADKRRPFVSIDELDGQRGVVIPGELSLELTDVDNDGLDDVIFPDGKAYTGYSRDITSIDSPVVRRTPTQFIIRLPGDAGMSASGYLVSVNGVFAEEFDSTLNTLVVEDMTGGAQAQVEVTLLSDDQILYRLRRLVPAYPDSENLTATLLAPRLVELTFNGEQRPPVYLNYLVWRDGVPIGRAVSGAYTYIDSDVELGNTYTYYITPDYIMDKSLDATGVLGFPLVQRQSNSVVVSTPGF